MLTFPLADTSFAIVLKFVKSNQKNYKRSHTAKNQHVYIFYRTLTSVLYQQTHCTFSFQTFTKCNSFTIESTFEIFQSNRAPKHARRKCESRHTAIQVSFDGFDALAQRVLVVSHLVRSQPPKKGVSTAVVWIFPFQIMHTYMNRD